MTYRGVARRLIGEGVFIDIFMLYATNFFSSRLDFTDFTYTCQQGRAENLLFGVGGGGVPEQTYDFIWDIPHACRYDPRYLQKII